HSNFSFSGARLIAPIPFYALNLNLPTNRKAVLPRIISSILFFSLPMLSPPSFTTQATKAQLEVSETLFTITTALNSCGYDAGLEDSLPVRKVVRAEVEEAVRKSPAAGQARAEICRFWQEHQPQGTSTDITQYVSLAL